MNRDSLRQTLHLTWTQRLAAECFLSRCVSESGKQKKAVVQWFARVSEVPLGKLKLLGREPHPQEIFYYEGRSCDDEVDAESILRPVQVKDAGTLAFILMTRCGTKMTADDKRQ